MESECLLYVVNGKSLQQKANRYMHSVCFYHLLVMIYTVCLLLTIYLSIQYCAIQHTEGEGHFGGERSAAFYHLNMRLFMKIL